MNERIKILRKELGLTLEKFGEPLGVKKAAISKIEKGENNVTEQMQKLICREYNVDYIWLTTGEGEMFLDSDNALMDRIDQIMYGEDDTRRNFIKSLVNASDEDIEALHRIADYYINLCRNEKKED